MEAPRPFDQDAAKVGGSIDDLAAGLAPPTAAGVDPPDPFDGEPVVIPDGDRPADGSTTAL